jgi:hypothetical protein
LLRRGHVSGAFLLAVAATTLGGCRETPAGPAETRVSLEVLGDPIIYAAVGATLVEDLQVFAADATSRAPARGISVEWRLIDGSASLTATSSQTDSDGVARTGLRPVSGGTFRVSASSPRMTGAAPQLEVRVVPPPVIQSIQPLVIAAGGEVVITGTNFSSDPQQNAVYFQGIRGRVDAATPTQLRVTVPTCLPEREVDIAAGLGAVVSNSVRAATSGGTGAVLTLTPGQVRTFTDPADFACVRLPGGPAGAGYLLVVHNAAQALTPPSRFELRALSPRPPLAAEIVTQRPAPATWADDFERRLRERERQFPEAGEDAAFSAASAQVQVPAVGDRREFNVLARDGSFAKATAIVRAVTARAIIYVDVDADASLSNQDISYYGAIFDDPIYSTNVEVFGAPSDIDGNGRIIILFTPRVNELTPRNESSFVAGFFYGCDLVARSRCSGTNQAEIFYSVVPDPPPSRWGDSRSQAAVRAAVPPVLAHEFQHMIHFARRGFSSDVLWLSEGLAHTAEEIVGDVLHARGDIVGAVPFRNGNLDRAKRYLAAPTSTSLIGDESPGTLELRGAAWLFLKHLRGRYGGNDLLRRLTSTTRSSVANVTQETGQDWGTLVTDFGIALWLDGAPQLTAPIDARYQFTGFDLRTFLGSFPLTPPSLEWGDFTATANPASAAQAYYRLTTPSDGSGQQLNFVLAGQRGAPFSAGSGMRLSVVRVR